MESNIPNSELPAASFRADEETRNKERATTVPQVILEQPRANPAREPLTKEQTQAAKEDLLNKNIIRLEYPRTRLTRRDPTIGHQRLGLISFVPARNATPDAQGCYGVLKLRGNYQNEYEADEWGEKLIREVDSYSEILYVPVGCEFPLMKDDSLYTASTREVDIQKKVDDVVKAQYKQKKTEEKEAMNQINQRRDKLIDPTLRHEEDNSVDDIDMYTQLCVKKAGALQLIDESNKAIAKSNQVLEETNAKIAEIEAVNPSYKDEYIARYTRALNAIGANPVDNDIIKYMKQQ
jgi:hypothetical protein